MLQDDLERYLYRFARDEAAAVVELFHGKDWYIGEKYAGPTIFEYPSQWDAYPGHYRSWSPWASNIRVVLRKGKLALLWPWGGSEEALTQLPDGSFRVGDDLRSPDRVRFSPDAVVDGHCLRVNIAGADFDRFFTS